MTCAACGRTHDKRGSSYPFGDDTVPEDWIRPYRDDPRYAHIDLMDEAEDFRDRNLAAPGSKGVYKCWRAAWRKWMRNALRWHPQPITGLEGRKTVTDWQRYAQQHGLGARPGETYQAWEKRVRDHCCIAERLDRGRQ